MDFDVSTICISCDTEQLCYLTVDPFRAEVYPEEENDEEYWCEDCYNDELSKI